MLDAAETGVCSVMDTFAFWAYPRPDANLNLLSNGGVYDARETGEALRDAEDRPVEPLEGGTVVASDWARLRQGTCVHSLSVVASWWDCSANPSAFAARTHTGGAGGHLARDRFRFVD